MTSRLHEESLPSTHMVTLLQSYMCDSWIEQVYDTMLVSGCALRKECAWVQAYLRSIPSFIPATGAGPRVYVSEWGLSSWGVASSACQPP